jgi:hypothetical protein
LPPEKFAFSAGEDFCVRRSLLCCFNFNSFSRCLEREIKDQVC